MRVDNFIKISIFVFIACAAMVGLYLVSEPVFSQVISKNAESIPPGVDILPGGKVKVQIRFPGGTKTLRNPADTMLVMDRTGSMGGRFGGISKIQAAKNALKAFVDQTDEDTLPSGSPGDYVGLATYADTSPYGDCNPTTSNCASLDFPITNMTGQTSPTCTGNKCDIEDRCTAWGCGIDNFNDNGNTSIGAGMDIANKELLDLIAPASTTRRASGVPQYMVLATDGIQNTTPSPYENNILQTTLDNDIVVFTVGIGNDARNVGGIGAGCTGCPDIPSIPGTQTSGEMIMKDIACQTDQHRPNPADNCNKTWNTGNACDANHTGAPTVNDLDCPSHYFFANNPANLENFYRQIANEIQKGRSYQILDSVNTTVFKQLEPSTFKVVGGPVSVNCDTAPAWYVDPTTKFVSYLAFLLLIDPIPEGYEVCVSFEATVHDLDDDVYVDTDGDGYGDTWVKFSTVLGSGNNFNVDGETRIAAIWDKDDLGTCDNNPKDGSLSIFEILWCIQTMMDQPNVEIPQYQIYVTNPARPWLQTKYGDVGVVGTNGNIDVDRNLSSPQAKDLSGNQQYNNDYLVILKGAIINEPFTAAKSWLVPGYTSLSLPPFTPPPASMYQALWNKYSKRCTPNPPGGQAPGDVAAAAASCSIIRYTGDLTISDDAWALSGYSGSPAIVFVEGNLTIYQSVVVGPDTGLIFVVKGNISLHEDYINEGELVGRLDGIYITDNEFNSRGTVGDCSLGDNDNKLVVNGAVYAFGRACFTRALPNNLNDPAELINFEPKYLWLFRDIIGNSKVVYREIVP